MPNNQTSKIMTAKLNSLQQDVSKPLPESFNLQSSQNQ